ncbi:dipicolinate synthase subunit DpsA [Natronospora cellulosivora (SeqCode)]
MKIAVIGGDKREEILIDYLADIGYKISVLSNNQYDKKNIGSINNIKDCLYEADVVIAPMSSTDKDGFLKATFLEKKIKLDEAFFSQLKEGCIFLIGILKNEIKEIAESLSIEYIELAKLDNLAIMNAIPTAEGAIKIAIEETDTTLYNSKILVYGLGKVGYSLAWRLKALGAQTYAVTRDKGAIARGKDIGIKMIKYDQLQHFLPKMNIIFNTVPAKIIDYKSLLLLNKKSVIIDLASAPGGIDFKSADKMGIKTILALGLPGKVAPRTAGKILADIIPDLIGEV